MSRGHAIEARVYAENPAKGFLPATGVLKWLKTPPPVENEVRVETGVVEGDAVTVYYDPMIAKLLTWYVQQIGVLMLPDLGVVLLSSFEVSPVLALNLILPSWFPSPTFI